MPSDYAQGGWAKLDLTAADELSNVISTFNGTKLKLYTKMLLALYSSMHTNGTITMGYRTLADKAGTKEGVAKRFIEKLEDEGVLLNLGQIITAGGKYTKRMFYWIAEQNEQINEGGSENRLTHGSKFKEKTTDGGSKLYEKTTHIRIPEYSDSVGRFPNGTAPTETENISKFDLSNIDIENMPKPWE